VRWTPRALLPVLVGLFVVLSAGVALALPATQPDNTGMVDDPNAGPGGNTVAIRSIVQAGNVTWMGGIFTEIDDSNGVKITDASALAPFDATSGALAAGVHIPIVTDTGGIPEVYDMSLGPDGNLYFAGNFDHVDGSLRNGVGAINPATGQLVAGFHPTAGAANSVLATASAIYVGTSQLKSFQLNGTATPGWTSPTVIIDASIRQHETLPQIRDIAIQGNTVVAACQCDSMTDATGTDGVKAVIEVNAQSGHSLTLGSGAGQHFWVPAGLDTSGPNISGAFGITLLVHNYPNTNTPTIYLAAGGSDFTAAYDLVSGAQKFKEDTSGSSQAITWYQGYVVVGGHFDWTQKAGSSTTCADNDHPAVNSNNTAYICWHTPKLTAFSASNGDPMLDNTGNPWNPGICCKYNGVWVVYAAPDGSTLYIGGEFTKVGGTWHDNDAAGHLTGLNWTLQSGIKQQFWARLGGPIPPTQTLTLLKSTVAGATGTVTSSPSGINCTASCSGTQADFSTNSNVTLTATPTAGNSFLGWSSGDAGFNCPGTGPCTVNMNIGRSVTANFAGVTFPLTVTKTGTADDIGLVTSNQGSINCGSTCSAPIPQNTVVTLTATPGPNSQFTGWSGEGCSGTGTCVVTMSAARNVTANFNSTLATLQINKVLNGSTAQGTVTSTPSGISCTTTCTGPVSHAFSDPTVTLHAVPKTGNFIFSGWSSSDPGFDCPGLGDCTVTMDQNRTVTATFAVAKNVKLSYGGTGSGTVTSGNGAMNCNLPADTVATGSCDTLFGQNEDVTLTANADANSIFTGWSSTGAVGTTKVTCPGLGTCSFNMGANAKWVTATFQPAFTLTVAPGGDGDGTVTSNPAGVDCGLTCSSKFQSGTNVILTATAGDNSFFAGWSGEGCSGTGTCAVSMTQARNVTATFNLVPRHLTVTVIGNGTVNDSPGPINCTGPQPDTGQCQNDYEHGTDVDLIATPAANWAFTGWSGACTGSLDCFVSMVQDQTVTATFERITHTVTVHKAGSGTGTVTSSPAGIDCGNDCIDGFNQGDDVTLTAAEDVGSVFTGWSGNCTGTGTCDLGSINAAKDVTATFELLHTVTVNNPDNSPLLPSGTVTSDVGGISCPGTCQVLVVEGTQITLTAQPDNGSALSSWGGDCNGNEPTCTLTVDSDKTVSPTWVIGETLTVDTSGSSGTGTVTSAPAWIDCGSTCSADFAMLSSVTLHAAADAGSAFTGWDSADIPFSCPGTGDCTVSMDQARNVTATFTKTYTLTVQRAGSGGAGTVNSSPSGIDCGVTCTYTFLDGTQVTLTAADGSNTTFDNWTGDTDCDTTNPCVVTMDQDRNITAHYDPVLRQLSVTKTGGTGTGTVTSNPTGIDCGSTCSFAFQLGSSITLHAVADGTSVFVGWTGDTDGGCLTTSDCTVTMDQARTVNAQFDLAQRSLTVHTAGNGNGSVTSDDTGAINCPGACGANYAHGTPVTLTAHLGANSTFTGWSGDCSSSGTNTTCILTMNAAKDATATFALVKHTLTASKNGNGTGVVSSNVGAINCGATCSDLYDHGTAIILTATPDANNVFAGWSGGGCSGTGTCSVTLNVDTTVTATFTKVQHTLTAVINVTGGATGTVASNVGTINCPGTCANQYDHGTVVQLTATPTNGSTFAGWSGGGCSGTSNPCTVTLNADTTVTAAFTKVNTTPVPNNDPMVQFNGWVDVQDGANYYRQSNVLNDKITFKTIAGTSVQWLTRIGPDGGNAKVTIDGTVKETFNEYAASAAYTTRTYNGLPNTVHTVVITVLHTKVAASTNYFVRLDGFKVGTTTTTQESDPKVQYDTWKSTSQAAATDGTYRSSKTATATVTVKFTGTSIDWVTAKGKAYGKAKVTIDGGTPATIDLYKATTTWQSIVSFSGLSAGNHTLVIQVLNQKNASATATTVVIDGFVVHA
jgi:hypothetical protein